MYVADLMPPLIPYLLKPRCKSVRVLPAPPILLPGRDSSGKSHGSAGFGFGRFLLPVLRRSRRLENAQQARRNAGDLVNGGVE
jgi:hypothetical protein